MKLHHPAAPAVHLAAFAEEIVRVVGGFVRAHGLAGEGFPERFRRGFCVAAAAGREFQPVVAGPASVFREEIMGFPKDVQQDIEAVDFGAPALPETFDVGRESALADLHGRVGTPGRTHDRTPEIPVDGPVVFERVGGVVRRTHHADVHAFQERLRPAFLLCQDLVHFPPDEFAGLGAQELRDAEKSEVEVNPLVNGISRDPVEDVCHGDELVVRRGASGDLFFRHACLAQDFPDIVVGGREKFPGVLEILVARDGRDVGMIVRVKDRESFDGVENAFSGFVSDEVVLTEEHGESFLDGR